MSNDARDTNRHGKRRTTRSFTIMLALALVVWLGSCGGGTSSTSPNVPATDATTTTTYSPPAWLASLKTDTTAIGDLMQRLTDAYGNGQVDAVGVICQGGEGGMPGWQATLATIDNPSVSVPYGQALGKVQQTFVDCLNANWTGMLRDIDEQHPYVEQATSAINALPQP